MNRYKQLLGPELDLFLLFSRKPMDTTIRINTIKIEPNRLISRLKSKGWVIEHLPWYPLGLRVKYPKIGIGKAIEHRLGYFYVQGPASMIPPIVLDPKPGEIVVDMCAAPGGKTSHMAELMKNQGKIYAFDIDPVRIERMKETLRRLGIKNVEIYQEDVLKAPKILGEEFADKVLLDAPCSSSGVLAKYPEIRWRLRPEKIIEFAKQQYKMLKVAIRLAKPGGKILYTTCSIFPEEGEEVVKKILNEYGNYIKLIPLNGPYSPGFLEGTMRAWPHKHDTTGFFYALFEKIKSLK